MIRYFVLQLDMSCDGLVDWDEFCQYLLLQFTENEIVRRQSIRVPFHEFPMIKFLSRNKVRLPIR